MVDLLSGQGRLPGGGNELAGGKASWKKVTLVCRGGSYTEVAFMCPPRAATALVGARTLPRPGLRMGRSSGDPEGWSWKGFRKDSALLSSPNGYLLEPTEWPKGSQQRERPGLHSQALAWPPRLSTGRRASGSQRPWLGEASSCKALAWQ